MAKPKSPVAIQRAKERAAAHAERMAAEKESRALLKRMNKKPRCIECESWNVRMTTGAEVYPHRPDLADLQFWMCECGAYIGCRKDSDYAPVGRPAGPVTRKAREAAQAIFEPIWKAAAARDEIHPNHARQRGYKWLAEQLGSGEERLDINMMTAAQANQVIEICKPLVTKRT